MLEIVFSDSGYLKYADGEDYNYLYAINTMDYPTMHSHVDYWEFFVVTEGTLKNCVAGREAELCTEKNVCFMTTRDCHALWKASETVRYINISVRESHLLRILDVISPNFQARLLQGARSFRISDTLLSEVENLLHQCNLLSPVQLEKKNGLLCSAVLLLLQELNRIHLNVHEHLSPFMKKLLPLTEKKEFIGYSATDLSHALNYSPAHLNRLFKEHFGMAPYEYLQKHKFRYARNLLQNTDMSMQEIAAEIGYSNLSHFFSNFKRYYGITPGDCRKGVGAISIK
ncbi:MAG: AraC family transcriptional regulator [Clostridia bacterium]|nr:AraC family transcriptional regulator [Clostridia bacterium]